MKTVSTNDYIYKEPINILLVGNNPMDLGNVHRYLTKFPKRKVIIEYCFDLKESIIMALKCKPTCILLDDTYSKRIIKNFIDTINGNNRTKDIPITLLKSSNYRDIVTSGVQEYLLKENLTSERLYRTILKAIKFKRTQRILKIERRRRKRQLDKLVQSIRNSIYQRKSIG